MFDRLKTALGIAAGGNEVKSIPESSASTAPRELAEITAELAMARESQGPLERKLAAAQAEMAAAQQVYDAGIQAYALGEAREPNRGDLQACLMKFEALRRVSHATAQRIAALAGEQRVVELADAIAAGAERLPALASVGEARLEEFRLAVTAARRAENALFVALFDQREGLRQRQPSEELGCAARKIRFGLRNRAMEVARLVSYVIDNRFETDGELNLGAEHMDMHVRRQLTVNAADVARRSFVDGFRIGAEGGR